MSSRRLVAFSRASRESDSTRTSPRIDEIFFRRFPEKFWLISSFSSQTRTKRASRRLGTRVTSRTLGPNRGHSNWVSFHQVEPSCTGLMPMSSATLCQLYSAIFLAGSPTSVSKNKLCFLKDWKLDKPGRFDLQLFFIDFLWVKRFSLVELPSPKMPIWSLCVDQADTSGSTKGTIF